VERRVGRRFARVGESSRHQARAEAAGRYAAAPPTSTCHPPPSTLSPSPLNPQSTMAPSGCRGRSSRSSSPRSTSATAPPRATSSCRYTRTAPPHTLTPSHPHTLTPSHPHTLTPSPPIPHPPPSHPHTLTSMPSPSTFHTLGERGPRLVRRALGLPLRMLLLHLRMQGAARHLRRAPRIRPDQIGEARLLRHGVRGGYHRVGIPLLLSVTTRCGGSGAGEGWRGLCGGECVACRVV